MPDLPAVIQAVESRLPELRKLLPADVSTDTFLSHFKTAVMQSPDLVKSNPRSVVQACVRAANDGLMLDGREAVIIVRNHKRQDGSWEKVAVYQRMYGGTLKRIRAAMPGCRIEARLVHEQDTFMVSFGDHPAITHTPHLGQGKGAILGVYAIVTETNGTQHREVMELDEIERIRDGSQNYDPTKPRGPWHDHFGEMARKTVLNRLAKLLPQASGRPPLQPDADDTGGADDELEVYDTTTVALPADTRDKGDNVPDVPDVPVKTGTVAALPNGGEISSGKAPFKREEKPEEAVVVPEAQDDVTLWKTRLRELRAEITDTLTSIGVEEAWETWEEKYKPVPEEVVTAAKGLIDKRLAVIRGADDYKGMRG